MRQIAPHIGLFMALLIGLSSSFGLWYEQHFCFCEGELHLGVYQEANDCCQKEMVHSHHCDAEKGCDQDKGCGESETFFWQLDVDYVPATLSFELPSLAVAKVLPATVVFSFPKASPQRLPLNKAPPLRSAQQRRVLLQSFLC